MTPYPFLKALMTVKAVNPAEAAMNDAIRENIMMRQTLEIIRAQAAGTKRSTSTSTTQHSLETIEMMAAARLSVLQ